VRLQFARIVTAGLLPKEELDQAYILMQKKFSGQLNDEEAARAKYLLPMVKDALKLLIKKTAQDEQWGEIQFDAFFCNQSNYVFSCLHNNAVEACGCPMSAFFSGCFPSDALEANEKSSEGCSSIVR
jgi:hypothetical protein